MTEQHAGARMDSLARVLELDERPDLIRSRRPLLAVGAGGQALRAVGGRIILLVTGAVWPWDTMLFALWFVVGD